MNNQPLALFIDDEAFGLQALFAILESEGISCILRSNMSDAMNFLKKNKVSVVVTDIMMPPGELYMTTDSSVTGFTLINEVQKLYPETPIICLSVVGDQSKINQLKRKGVLYLRKGETSLNTAANLIKSKISGVATF